MKKVLIPLLALGGAMVLQPAVAQDGEALFKSKPCAACHSIDAKMVGPALKEVAAKYAGQDGAADLLAGHVQVVFAPISESIQQIKAGKLRALAVTPAARLDVLPDVPTIAEFVPGYEASGFAGISVRKGTPAEIVDLLNKQLNAALADPKIKGRIVELGGTVTGGTPAEFGKIVSEATEKWAKVIKVAGIKPE